VVGIDKGEERKKLYAGKRGRLQKRNLSNLTTGAITFEHPLANITKAAVAGDQLGTEMVRTGTSFFH
jgi:hypothetical protein